MVSDLASPFCSVAKYSKILSGPLRSRIRFSYLKKVRCLVDNGRICHDCRATGCQCCLAAALAVSEEQLTHTFSSGCMVATSSSALAAAGKAAMVPAAVAARNHPVDPYLTDS